MCFCSGSVQIFDFYSLALHLEHIFIHHLKCYNKMVKCCNLCLEMPTKSVGVVWFELLRLACFFFRILRGSIGFIESQLMRYIGIVLCFLFLLSSSSITYEYRCVFLHTKVLLNIIPAISSNTAIAWIPLVSLFNFNIAISHKLALSFTSRFRINTIAILNSQVVGWCGWPKVNLEGEGKRRNKFVQNS